MQYTKLCGTYDAMIHETVTHNLTPLNMVSHCIMLIGYIMKQYYM